MSKLDAGEAFGSALCRPPVSDDDSSFSSSDGSRSAVTEDESDLSIGSIDSEELDDLGHRYDERASTKTTAEEARGATILGAIQADCADLGPQNGAWAISGHSSAQADHSTPPTTTIALPTSISGGITSSAPGMAKNLGMSGESDPDGQAHIANRPLENTTPTVTQAGTNSVISRERDIIDNINHIHAQIGGGGVAESSTNPTLPSGRSKEGAHWLFEKKEAVFISLDIETAGEGVGIVQLSGEIIRFDLVRNKHEKGKNKGQINPNGDTIKNVVREDNKFNRYVKPSGGEWCPRSIGVHGLHPQHPSIVSAGNIHCVWTEFESWVNSSLGEDEVAILVAYNGETCDLKWIWKLTQAPRSPLNMPTKIQYFMDPLKVIKQYKSCKINPVKSKLESLDLGSVWSFLNNGQVLEGAHDSLVDAKAQADLLVHEYFVPFIDRANSITTIDKIFDKKKTDAWKKKMEPLREVHSPWMEQTRDNEIVWEALPEDKYTGPKGGPDTGPSMKMKLLARNATSLAIFVIAILPWAFWCAIAKSSQKYAHQDYVVEVFEEGRRRPKLKRCTRDTEGARHRCKRRKHRKAFTFTPEFILCFVSILIIQGAYFGSDKPPARYFWGTPPFGISVAVIRNAMKRDAFEFARRFIHVADNDRQIEKGQPGYDPLFKIRYVLDEVGKGLRSAWTAGKNGTIDESMIKYKGKYVAFVQYMRDKPIKHGLKVFSCCCSIIAVMLSFSVYVGKEYTEDGSAVAVCEELIKRAGLVGARGRVLTTDNWYTSVALATLLFEKYGWSLVGTITPTDKKARAGTDLPFHKLSQAAKDEVSKGWFREAVIEMKTATGKQFYIQCTTWRDKKQVMFLSSNRTGSSEGKEIYVLRGSKGTRKRAKIAGTIAQQDYAAMFAAVDRNDRDSADYSITIRTIRWYIRVFCWLIDRVIHMIYVIVVCAACSGLGPSDWKRYTKKGRGRREFQIQLGLDLMTYAISKAWDGKGPRPDWMRTGPFVPCECKRCYFCLNGITTGVAHRAKKQKLKVVCLKTGTIGRTDQCLDEAVDLGKGCSYCRMCMRKQIGATDINGNKLSYVQKRQRCNFSRMGCPQPSCNDHICNVCWASGYDKHKK